jgi:hypothetical protein
MTNPFAVLTTLKEELREVLGMTICGCPGEVLGVESRLLFSGTFPVSWRLIRLWLATLCTTVGFLFLYWHFLLYEGLILDLLLR